MAPRKDEADSGLDPLAVVIVDPEEEEQQEQEQLPAGGDGREAVHRRDVWGKGIDFVVACVGFAVGMGNIWRFPYLCYKNGGGAFLVPYFLYVFVAAAPLLFLEVGLGQFMSQGNVNIWNICPIFKGLGIGSTLMVFYTNIYYIVVFAWIIHYFCTSVLSLANGDEMLPWATCGNWWNSEGCISVAINDTNSIIHQKGVNATIKEVDSGLEFWEEKVLRRSDGLYDIGGFQWELVGSLAAAWIMSYICLFKGVRSSGKVVYFTAPAPFIILTILLVRGLTLPGCLKGLRFYLEPDFTRLNDTQVWLDAGSQVLYSYACTFGGMVTLGSFNKYNRDFFKDCGYITFANSFASLYGGCVIFAVLGYMSHVTGIPVEKVADSGPGLIFIVYPKAISLMPFPHFWAILFFFMLIVVAIDSVFVQAEALITSMMDVLPAHRQIRYERELFSAFICFTLFLLGLPMVTEGGAYVFQIFDYYVACGIVLITYCFAEVVAIAWVYDVDRWYADIKDMIGRYPSRWFAVCWKYITPLATLGLLTLAVVKYRPLKYNSEYEYPLGGQVLGLVLGFSHVIFLPLYFLYALLVAPGVKIKEKWRSAIAPQMEETLALRSQQLRQGEDKDASRNKTAVAEVEEAMIKH